MRTSMKPKKKMTFKKLLLIVALSFLGFIVVIAAFSPLINKHDNAKYKEDMDTLFNQKLGSISLDLNTSSCDTYLKNANGLIYKDEYLYLPRSIEVNVYDVKKEIREDTVFDIVYELDENIFELVGSVTANTEKTDILDNDKDSVTIDEKAYKNMSKFSYLPPKNGAFKYKINFPDTKDVCNTDIKASMSYSNEDKNYHFVHNVTTTITIDNKTNRDLRKLYNYKHDSDEIGVVSKTLFSEVDDYGLLCSYVEARMFVNENKDIVLYADTYKRKSVVGDKINYEKYYTLVTANLTKGTISNGSSNTYYGLNVKLFDKNTFTEDELLASGIYQLSTSASIENKEARFVYEVCLPLFDEFLRIRGFDDYLSMQSRGMSFSEWIGLSNIPE